MTAGFVNGRDWTPRERLRGMRQVLRKRRGLIIKTMLILLVATVLGTWLMTPAYKAESSLYVRLEQEPATEGLAGSIGSAGTRLGSVSPLAVMNSYVEALKSRTTAEQIVREFKLDERPDSPALRDRIKKWMGREARKPFHAALRMFSSNFGAGGAGDQHFRETVDDLRSGISAEVDQDTELILLTVLYDDPHLAQQINQRMLEILMERSVGMSRADAAAAYQAEMASLPAASARLRAADQALAAFKRRHGIVTLSDEQRIRVERLDKLQSAHEQATADLQETTARIDVLRKEFRNRRQPITVATTVEENPQVRRAKADLYDKEVQLAGILQTYTEDHPDVVRLKSQIATAQGRLRSEVARVVGSETKGLSPEYATLVQSLIDAESGQMGLVAKQRVSGQALASFRASLRNVPATERDLEELLREQTVAEDLYRVADRRVYQLQAASLNPAPPLSMAVVDPARLPRGIRDIGSPRYKVIAILAPVLALLLGFTAAFVAEYFDDTLGSEQEVNDLLSLPVLGSLPYLGSTHESFRLRREG